MKASELRIGNWISIGNNPKHKLTKKSIIHVFENSKATPIPLNEKWFLKFGFDRKTIRDESVQGDKSVDYEYRLRFKREKCNFNIGGSWIEFEFFAMHDQDDEDGVSCVLWICEFKNEPEEPDAILVPLLHDIKYVNQLQNIFHALTGEELPLSNQQISKSSN